MGYSSKRALARRTGTPPIRLTVLLIHWGQLISKQNKNIKYKKLWCPKRIYGPKRTQFGSIHQIRLLEVNALIEDKVYSLLLSNLDLRDSSVSTILSHKSSLFLNTRHPIYQILPNSSK